MNRKIFHKVETQRLRYLFCFTVLSFTVLSAMAFTSEIKTVILSDGEQITARLSLPEEQVNTIVVAVHGTGPNTYLNKRPGFNYYDVLAEGFCKQGVAFFSYNRRGVEIGDTPPMFDKIDSVKFAEYLPYTEAEDIETMVSFLKKDKRFEHCKIILYGISEGTIIASMVADRQKVKIDALLLHGYAHENMFDIIKWQNMGEGVMKMINSIFDKNKDNAVSKEEYEFEDPTLAAYRNYLFSNLSFDSTDVVKDNVIDIKDIRQMRAPFNDALMAKIAENDGAWIWQNYVKISIGWLREHFALEPNKTRLLRINIPIHIFHGTEDANVPVESVYDLESRFKVCKKSNLTIHIFDKHNHDLNFQDWITNKEFSDGLQAIFNTSGNYINK
ncbi:MAG: alpha/beta hydrolase [Prevotellaceae bacterium]|nr:alpha/beta hydrolase [Prevotellaceae bacterium]